MKNRRFTPQVIDTACKIIKNDSLIPDWKFNNIPTTFGYLAARVPATSPLVINFTSGLIIFLMPVTNGFRFLTEMAIGNGSRRLVAMTAKGSYRGLHQGRRLRQLFPNPSPTTRPIPSRTRTKKRHFNEDLLSSNRRFSASSLVVDFSLYGARVSKILGLILSNVLFVRRTRRTVEFSKHFSVRQTYPIHVLFVSLKL